MLRCMSLCGITSTIFIISTKCCILLSWILCSVVQQSMTISHGPVPCPSPVKVWSLSKERDENETGSHIIMFGFGWMVVGSIGSL